MRTKEELGNELCKYCPLNYDKPNYHDYLNDCPQEDCEVAYSYYEDECTETCVMCGEKIHPDETEYIKTTVDSEYGPLCHRCYEKRSS